MVTDVLKALYSCHAFFFLRNNIGVVLRLDRCIFRVIVVNGRLLIVGCAHGCPSSISFCKCSVCAGMCLDYTPFLCNEALHYMEYILCNWISCALQPHDALLPVIYIKQDC